MFITTEVDRPNTRITIVYGRTLNGIDQAMTLSQHEVQSGIHSRAAQQIIQQVKRHTPRMVCPIRARTYHDMGLMRIAMTDHRRPHRHLRKGLFLQGNWRFLTLLDRLLKPHDQAVKIDASIHKKHRFHRKIMTLCEAHGISRRKGSQVLCRSQNIMSERMTAEEQILKLIINQFGRRIIIALYLVANHFHFTFDFRLWILTMKYHIGQDINSHTQMLFLDGSIIDRTLLVGKGVQFTTDALQGIDNLQGITTLRALKGHVLTKMRQALFTGPLIACSCCNLETTIDHRRSRRQVNHAQAGGQCLGIVFHIQPAKVRKNIK